MAMTVCASLWAKLLFLVPAQRQTVITLEPRFFCIIPYCIITVMNKRAKKRVKEAIKKEVAERLNNRQEHGAPPVAKKLPESRGFTPRPDKKRG